MQESDILMSLAIAIIMFGIGLNLKSTDFVQVFRRPRAVVTGLSCQLIILPMLAFALAWFWPMDPLFKVGIMIIASAPGGTASNLVTTMLKGRVALSVSMTTINSFVIVLTIPFYVDLGLQTFLGENTHITLSFLDIFSDILLTVFIPVIAGVVFNELTSDKLTDRLQRPLRLLLPALLVMVALLALFTGEESGMGAVKQNFSLFIPLIFLNLLTMVAGFYIARIVRVEHASNFTIAVEMGLQNSALAIYVASQILQNSSMELVAVFYSSFSFFTTWLGGWIMKHYMKPRASKLHLLKM